eukprot:Skav219745  [mRNA]  locus=scaffold569:43469:45145:+ [translate_table: standard]
MVGRLVRLVPRGHVREREALHQAHTGEISRPAPRSEEHPLVPEQRPVPTRETAVAQPEVVKYHGAQPPAPQPAEVKAQADAPRWQHEAPKGREVALLVCLG